MPRYTYDRLSAQDNNFLLWERGNVRMHIASTMVCDAGPLRRRDGGIDVDTFKRATESFLHLVPRYRQRLHAIPFFDHAVWVDDPHFDIDYHIRHTALPVPGSADQLKKLSARIMAQPLDRKHPLWETWIVEGLEGDRFAMITKIHHCMIDGASGVDLAYIQMSPTPEVRELGTPPRFYPRPAPSRFELWRDEVARQIGIPFAIVRDFRQFTADAEDLGQELLTRAKAVVNTLGMGTSADETPMNGRGGPHRRVDWLTCQLDDMKAVRKAWGCTINDVVLTIVTGAVREYLLNRRVDPTQIEFRVSSPVSVRREEERGKMGNKVSSWIIPLPISCETPREQLDAIHTHTRELKESRQALGVEMMMQVAEWTPSTLLALGARAMSGPINTIVTNVPGPQIPLYFHGARVREIYPMVPLLDGMGLGIAVTSYAGAMSFGFNADPDIVPDLDVFTAMMRRAFERVAAAAGVALAEPPKPAASTRRARKALADAPAPTRANGNHTAAAK
jgi:diacylglycerol O-acyltransferase / wax synthase